MSFAGQWARNTCRNLFFCATLVVAQAAIAASWNYLGGPFGGQPLTLFNDAAGNTWAGLNGSGVYYRPAGSVEWRARPGLPTQSNTKITVNNAGTGYITGSAGVFSYPAGATTWLRVSGTNGLPGQAAGGLITDSAGNVYVAMNSPSVVYKLPVNTATWVPVGAGLPIDLLPNDLVIDSTGNLWASIYGTGVYKLAPGSTVWAAVGAGLNNSKITSLAVVGNDLFAGIQFGGVYKLTNSAIGGSTWSAWTGGAMNAGDAVYALARGTNDVLYAAGYGAVYALPGGSPTWVAMGTGLSTFGPGYALVYSTLDGSLTLANGTGALVLPSGSSTWAEANIGMTASTVYDLIVTPNGDLYAATFGQGVQWQVKGTSVWTPVDPERMSSVVEAITVNSVGNIFASSSGAVLKLTAGTWTTAGVDQGGFAFSLTVDGANTVWAGQNGAVHRLPAGASTWLAAGTGLPGGQSVNALAIDGAATAYAGILGTGVYALTAGGTTWTARNTGLPDTNVRALQRDSTGFMYAGVGQGVYKFVAGAWQPVASNQPSDVAALAFDANGDLYAGTENNYVWRLALGSSTWVQVQFGLGSRTVQALAVGGGHIYAGTESSRGSPSGVFDYNRLDSVVEFYNNLLDNYFITAEPVEQAAVDNGAAGPGWSRTGDYFNAGGATKVCRFYGSLSPGPNSHFYTINPAECQLLKDLQATTPANLKRWNFESNDFSSASPVGGGCGSGTMPVYRAYNNGFARGIDSNHRITANNAAYLAQVAKGWIGEGIVLCAPAN